MAEEPDVSIEKVPLTEANINPCRGCNACEKLNKCIQSDGMDTYHDKIVEADCIVLSSPIYCMGLCSQVKALVDRAQVFRSRKYVLKLPIVPPERKGKRLGVFLATAGQNWPHVFDAAVPSVKCFYHVIDINDADISYLMVNGVDEMGAIEHHPDRPRRCKKTGKIRHCRTQKTTGGRETCMTLKVLGISGSPHRHGNTETLLDSFLEGARAAGASVEKVVLKEINYSPCQGCNACHKTGDCIVKDDAPGLYDKILSADIVAVASPIYSMGITAQLKGFIDRAQYLWARKFILKTLDFSEDHIKRHKGVFISTAGQSLDHVFDSAFPAITALFHGTGFDYSDNIVANDMDRYNGIKNHPTALKEAYHKGQQIVRDLEIITRKRLKSFGHFSRT